MAGLLLAGGCDGIQGAAVSEVTCTHTHTMFVGTCVVQIASYRMHECEYHLARMYMHVPRGRSSWRWGAQQARLPFAGRKGMSTHRHIIVSDRLCARHFHSWQCAASCLCARACQAADATQAVSELFQQPFRSAFGMCACSGATWPKGAGQQLGREGRHAVRGAHHARCSEYVGSLGSIDLHGQS